MLAIPAHSRIVLAASSGDTSVMPQDKFTDEEVQQLRDILAAPQSWERPLLREFAAALLRRIEGTSEGAREVNRQVH